MTNLSRQQADAVATAAVALAKLQATSGGDDAPIADFATFSEWALGYGPRLAETVEELPFAFSPKIAVMVTTLSSWAIEWDGRLQKEKETTKGTPG